MDEQIANALKKLNQKWTKQQRAECDSRCFRIWNSTPYICRICGRLHWRRVDVENGRRNRGWG